MGDENVFHETTKYMNELDSLLSRIEARESSENGVSLEAEATPRRARAQSIVVGGLRHRSNRHRRARTSLGALWGSFSDSVSGSLTTISEGVFSEAELLRETFQEAFQDADEGKTYFLEMGMTRSLSLVPETIREFAQEASGMQVPLEVSKEDGNMVSRYVSLLVAVMAVSSNGAALSMLHGVSPIVKMYWRMTATALCLCFFAIRTCVREGFHGMTTLQWVTFGGAVISFTTQMLFYFYALEYTSIGNAVIGSNSQAILLIIGRVILGHRVLNLEGVGVMVAFAGVSLCSMEESNYHAEEEDDSENRSLGVENENKHAYGDALALCAGFAGLGYLTFAKAVRPHIPVTVFMFLVMFLGSLLVLVLALLFVPNISWSVDPNHGLFGWMNRSHDRLYIIIYIAIICNILGAMGFVRAMQYFDNIVIAVATLLEPATATVIAYVSGVGEWPSWMSWVGNALVVVGTLTVVYPSVNNNDQATIVVAQS